MIPFTPTQVRPIMFRPFLERELRRQLRKTHQVNLLDRAALMGAVADARAQLKAKTGADMPACAIEAPGGPVMDKLKELLAQFRAWLQTENGQLFLQILKAIVTALIAALIAGS